MLKGTCLLAAAELCRAGRGAEKRLAPSLIFLLLLLWLMPALAVPLPDTHAEASSGPGYLVGLRVQGSQVELDRVTALPRFEPVTPLPDAQAWRVEVRNSADNSLWSVEIASPEMLEKGMPPGAPLLMSFRIPVPIGEGLLRVVDSQGQLRYSLYLDAKVAEQARREREEFLSWLESSPKALEMDEAEEAEAADYIARHQAITAQHAEQNRHGLEQCIAQGMQFIPELARTNQPCAPLHDHAHAHAHAQVPAEQAKTAADFPMPDELAAPELEWDEKDGPPPPRYVMSDMPTEQGAVSKAKVTLNGRILGSNGEAPGAALWVYVNDGLGNKNYKTDAQGRFSAEVEAGRQLTVMAFPPAPWLGGSFTHVGITQTTTREYRLERGILVSGKINVPDASVDPSRFTIFAYYYLENGSYGGSAAVIQRDGKYSLAIPKNKVADIDAHASAPILIEKMRVGPYAANTTLNITAVRGLSFSGRIVSDARESISGGYLSLRASSAHLSRNVTVSATGEFNGLVAPGRDYRVQTGASKHFAQTFNVSVRNAAITRNITLERGAVLSGKINERSGGAAVADINVQVLDEAMNVISTGKSTSSGYSVLLRKNTRNIVEAGRTDETWMEPIVIDATNRDISRDISVPRRQEVSVTLKSASGSAMAASRVEIWSGNTFVLSATTDSSGKVKFSLPAGRYKAKVYPGFHGNDNNDYYGLHLYGHEVLAKDFTVSGTTTLNLKVAQGKMVRMKVESEWVPGNVSNRQGHRYYELLSGNTVVAWSRNWGRYEHVNGRSRLVADLYVPAGKSYRLRMHLPGSPTKTSATFTTREGGVVNIGMSKISESIRWKGKLRTSDNKPVAGVDVWIYTPTYVAVHVDSTGRDGSFDVPACSGCIYWFNAPQAGSSVAHVETLGRVRSTITRNITLDNLSLRSQQARNRRLQRLWGPASGERHDILFLGDGYTSGNETFTDRNGNGVWDGVLYYDLNQNGVWDRGEPYGRYGNAAEPVHGQDPTRNNEPFVDRNGDGAPNIGEARLFFDNARNYLRSVFGFDYWNERRDLFRAWTYLTYSQQAGSSVRVPGRGTIIRRNSMFNSTLETERHLLSIDYSRASQLAAEVLPSVDTIVILINQPVPAGRANAFILAHGGLNSNSPNAAVAGHEFGHNVGGLADEYSEFYGVYQGKNPNRHMSRSLDKRAVPWRDLLPASLSTRQPTRGGIDRPVGLYEGGSYQRGGVYRSTYDSAMRSNIPKFSEIQRLQMDERVLKDRELLRIPAVRQCSGTKARVQLHWDVRGLDVKRIQIRTGSLTGSNAVSPTSQRNSSRQTTQQVENGTPFFLFDAGTNTLLDVAKAEITRQGC